MKKPAIVAIAFALAFTSHGCSTLKSGGAKAVNAALDCALPSLWSVISPSALQREVLAAVGQAEPLGALGTLAETFGEAEVTCIVAKLDDAAPAKARAVAGVTMSGPSPTRRWLAQEADKGLLVTNFQGL